MDESTLPQPVISVITPTFNRCRQLLRLVAALSQQSVPAGAFEMIIVSDGSTDGTLEALHALTPPFPMLVIAQENQGVAAARNRGLAEAHARWVLFLDDDVVPVQDLVARHIEALSADENQVVLGPMLTPVDTELAPWVKWEQRMLEKQYDSMLAGRWAPTARQFYTGNTSLDRQHIIDAGGFDPAFRRAEDVELAYRLKASGLRFTFYPQAAAYHCAERSYASWLKIAYDYGRNDVIMTRTRGQTWLLPTILHEFVLRNPGVRLLTRACLDHPHRAEAALQLLKQAALLGSQWGWEAVSRYAFSGIFNLRYYQGIADELGGAQYFWLEQEA